MSQHSFTISFGDETISDTTIANLDAVEGVTSVVILPGNTVVITTDTTIVDSKKVARLLASMFPGKTVSW